jgi:putative transcriptional regulator
LQLALDLAVITFIKNILLNNLMKNNLKDLRQKENISQDDLASILKVSRQTINSIETGKFDPSLKLVMKMTKHFNVPLEQIFIYEEEK